MYKLLLIAIGGALGTLLRYGTGGLLAGTTQRVGFPFGTLTVNLAGCLLMGLLQGIFAERSVPALYRQALLVGFLGGYTTFSSYGWDTTVLLHRGQWGLAALNLGASNILGIALVLCGYFLGANI